MELSVALTIVAATALACWCGWGLARLALPEALRPYAGLLAPLLGYTLAMLLGYYFVWTISGLLLPLIVVLVLAGVLNVVAWRRSGPPRPLAWLRAEWPVLLLLLVTLLVGIAPLLHYGHFGIIGAGWDIETALPTARYLERGPIAAIAQAAPNPLRDLVRDPPRIGKTVGFAVWQGQIDWLTNAEAILTFVPLLAWLRVLGVLAVYLLLRGTFGLRRWPALLGAAWASAGALMLWTTYFNFEKQLSAWPLIPLGLLLGVAAVEDLARRLGERAGALAALRGSLGPLLVAAVAITAQVVAYYPALTLWVPLVLGVAAAILAERALAARAGGAALRTLGRLLGAALALSLLPVLLSIPALLDYWHGFSYRYSEQLTTLGVFRYIPFSDIVGLTPYAHGAADTPPTPALALGALALLAALMLAGLLLRILAPAAGEPAPAGDARLRWLGLALGALAYLAWLRWWQQYPYAYMKGGAYAGFVFVGLAAAGWQAISARLPLLLRRAAVALPLLLCVPMVGSQAQIVAQHWAQPGLYPSDFPALLALRQLIPAGSSVTLADDSRTKGVISGLAAYMLDHTSVSGHVQTGYTSAGGGAPDALGDYALLPADEDPLAWGYGAAIWRGGSYALYKRPDGALAHLRFEDVLAPQQSVTLALGAEHLAAGAEELPGGAARRLDLLVATLQPGTLMVGDTPFSIPAGGAWVRVGGLATGRTIELRNAGAAPLLLRTATLAQDSAGATGVTPLRAALVASAQARADGQRITASWETLLPDAGPITLALDIWDSDRNLHYGWYGFERGVGAATQAATLTLDLASGEAQAVGADGAPLPFGAQFGGLHEGNYSARLQISAGAALLASPGALFSFHADSKGAIDQISTSAIPMLMSTTDRPATSLDLQAGSDLLLQGYAIDRTSARPGDTLLLTLWWQALSAPGDERSVLVHLLDAQGAKVAQFDGAPARGARPTSQWQAGDTVLDSHTLQLPAELAPGQYTLVFGMYRWPSLERLELSDARARLPDDVARVPITITAAP